MEPILAGHDFLLTPLRLISRFPTPQLVLFRKYLHSTASSRPIRNLLYPSLEVCLGGVSIESLNVDPDNVDPLGDVISAFLSCNREVALFFF